MGDYQRDTGALSIAEHGAYFLMLQYHYATEKPLPKGKELYRMLRCETKAEREAVDSVAKLYWVETPDGWTNNRAAKEIEKAGDQADTNRRIAQEREERRRLERIEHERLNGTSHESCSDRAPNQTPEPEPVKTKSKAIARSAAASSPVRLGEGQVIETIPLVGQATAEVCETYVQEMDRLFPAVDVPQTLREIRAWNLVNPTRRKTASGIAKHVAGWLQKAQNGGR